MLLALLALLECAGCLSPTPLAVRCDVLSLPLEVDLAGLRPKTIEVRVHSGQVLVHPGEMLACDLRVDVFGVPVDDEADVTGRLELSPLRDTEDENLVRLSIEPPFGLPFDSLHAYYTLTVPADVALRVVSDRADVTLRGYAGDAVVRTASGRVRAVLAGGSCAIENSSGTTELSGEYRSASVETDSGPVDVTVPVDVVGLGELSLSSHTGDLKLRAGEHDNLELLFDTRHGVALSELPVRWIREQQTPGRVGFRSVGRLGSDAALARVRVRVHTGTGNLDLVHEPRDVPPAAAPLAREVDPPGSGTEPGS